MRALEFFSIIEQKYIYSLHSNGTLKIRIFIDIC